MITIPCGFRHEVVQVGSTETACCELLRRLIQDKSGQDSRVDRSACDYCWGGKGIDRERLAHVLGSAILSKSSDTRLPDLFKDSAGRQLKELSLAVIPFKDADSSQDGSSTVSNTSTNTKPIAVKRSVRTAREFPTRSVSVDVVLPVYRDDRCTSKIIDAWLRQQNAWVVLHLVLIDAESSSNWNRYRNHPSIRMHVFESDAPVRRLVGKETDALTNALASAQYISHLLETPFLAFGTHHALPHDRHLAHATSQLINSGSEWFAASLADSGTIIRSVQPDIYSWQRCVQLETAVLRRSLWIDLNGMADRIGDADVDFFQRINRQGRHAILSPTVAATIFSRRDVKEVDQSPDPFKLLSEFDPFELHQFGTGFQAIANPSGTTPCCDVVLPFHGQLGYVQQAIESILSQSDIRLTLHLIDDATPENIDLWLQRYLEDPRIRIYRNATNLGQFISFNNVAEYFETDWIATQDGDDISLPGRLAEMVRIGQLCNADMIAAATILDGPLKDVEKLSQLQTSLNGTLRHHRLSYPPNQVQSAYFLENPTIVHRRSHFEQMGGFADFAHPLKNRTSVDSEYMSRALWTNANIVAIRRLAVRYRVHCESAVHKEGTRIGSPMRTQAQRELNRRVQLLRQGGWNPRIFGALGRHRALTSRWFG